MKLKKPAILFCAVIVLCSFGAREPGYAADFSRAKQTYVPPSLIHRDLDALGTNNWNLPSPNTGSVNLAPTSGAPNPADATFSSFGGRGAAGASESGRINTGALTGAPTIDWGNALLTGSQYIPGVNKISSQINTLVSNGQLAEAESVARAGLKYFPASSTLKNKFTNITSTEAQAFCTSGNYDLAGKKAREALACNPNNKTAKIVEGKVLQSQGLNPSTAEAHVQSGDSLAYDGRLLEAGVEYKMSLNIKPTAGAHVGLGNLALGKGSLAEADRHYEQALAIDPQSAAAYRQRGALRYIMRDNVGANSDFGKAVALAPNDQLASDALVGLWKQQVSANPGTNSHLGLARAYMQTNNLEAARGEYKTVASLDPNNPALPEARRSFKLALAKQQAGQNVEAAKTLENQGAYAEAQQKLNEAVTLSPDDPQILFYHGQISEKLGLSDQAYNSYMNALRNDPKNAEIAQKVKMLTVQRQTNAGGRIESGEAKPAPTSPYPTFNMPINMPINPNAGAGLNESRPYINPNPTITVPINPNAGPLSPGPIPGAPNDILNVPLKSPLPQTKSEIIPDQHDTNFYVIDSADQVQQLASFFSSMQTLMLVQKYATQLSSTSRNNTY